MYGKEKGFFYFMLLLIIILTLSIGGIGYYGFKTIKEFKNILNEHTKINNDLANSLTIFSSNTEIKFDLLTNSLTNIETKVTDQTKHIITLQNKTQASISDRNEELIKILNQIATALPSSQRPPTEELRRSLNQR